MKITPSPLAVVIRQHENGFATDTPREVFRGVVTLVGTAVVGVEVGDVVAFVPKGTKIVYDDNVYWIVALNSLHADVSKC